MGEKLVSKRQKTKLAENRFFKKSIAIQSKKNKLSDILHLFVTKPLK